MSLFDASMDSLHDTDSEEIGFASPVNSTSSTVMDYDSEHSHTLTSLDLSFNEDDSVPLVDASTSSTNWSDVKPIVSDYCVRDLKWDGWAMYDQQYLTWLLKAESRLQAFDNEAPFVEVRRLLVGWLNDSCASMNIPPTTARASLSLLDYVLTMQQHIPATNWDLIALGCIVLAVKYAEIDTQLPLLAEIAHCGEYRYTFDQIREAEAFVLKVVDWRLDTITPSHFISFHQQRYSEEYTDPTYNAMIESLLDCALLDYGCRTCRPSLLAEGVINAARRSLGQPAIESIICSYPEEQIAYVSSVIINLAEDFQQELISNQAI